MRVHVLIDELVFGGAEMLLADFAAAAPSAGIDFSVGYLNEYESSPAGDALRAQGVQPELVCADRLLDLRALPRLRKHLQAVRPDIVHTHLELSDVLGSLAASSLGLPCVSTIHLIARQPTGQPSDFTRRGAMKARLTGHVRAHATARLVAVSAAARDAYLQTGWDSPERVVVVHNGIARAPTQGAGQRIREELGLSAQALVLSIVTVLRPGKGHEILFAAMQDLLPRFPQLRLVVLGDGPEREQLQSLAAPLADAVIFTGHRSDVMDVLAATDVLVHPTSMDAFPTTLLEAAAARVPVIATAVGGIPEIIDDGRTGHLIAAPPRSEALAEKLASLLGDEDQRRATGERAHARFTERFTAQIWAKRLREVYEEVLEERRGRERPPLAARQLDSAAPT
jgi:glycosyltransferase involved in cell wall biosynthesis